MRSAGAAVQFPTWAKEDHFDKRVEAGDATALADIYRDAIERIGEIADTLDRWAGITD